MFSLHFSFEHSSLVDDIVNSPLAFVMMIEEVALLVLQYGVSLVLLPCGFVLAEIFAPLLGHVFRGVGPGLECDGARAARIIGGGALTRCNCIVDLYTSCLLG